jgi:cytoskeleton protein RodZ
VSEFGEKFRKAREKKGLSLDDVSNVTKIGSRMLQAIEEEKFDQLPGGVFNKGFIRAYAKHLGINDQEAVTEYLECLRQAQIEAQAAWQPPTRAAAPEKRPLVTPNRREVKAQSPAQVEELPELQLPRAEHVRRPRQKYLQAREGEIPWRLVAVAVVVIVLVLVLWRRHSRSSVETAASWTATPAMQTAPAVVTPAAPLPASQSLATRAANSAPARTSAPTAAPINPSSQVTQPGAPGQATAAAPVNQAADTEKTETEKDDVTTRSLPAASTGLATKPASLTLVIRATENSWVSVSADGQTASHETLIAPAHTSVRASREIVAKVGNAAGVTFLWNGKEIPAQGEEAEVKTFVFDAQGMRVLAQSQTPAQNR